MNTNEIISTPAQCMALIRQNRNQIKAYHVALEMVRPRFTEVKAKPKSLRSFAEQKIVELYSQKFHYLKSRLSEAMEFQADCKLLFNTLQSCGQ